MFQFPGYPAATDILTFIHHHHQHMALGICRPQTPPPSTSNEAEGGRIVVTTLNHFVSLCNKFCISMEEYYTALLNNL